MNRQQTRLPCDRPGCSRLSIEYDRFGITCRACGENRRLCIEHWTQMLATPYVTVDMSGLWFEVCPITAFTALAMNDEPAKQ